ncbi:MAG: TetR/AcrR family transcriptional regulator [Acidobacteriota bacterium]
MTNRTAVFDEGRMSSEERRKQLIRVALTLFSKHGFCGTTTKEIARMAGVNEAIVFRHFPSKETLYSAILDYKANEAGSEDWIDDLRQFTDSNDDEGLIQALIKRIVDHHRKDRDFLRLMFYSALEDHTLAQRFRDKHVTPLHKFLRDYIIKRQREGAFAGFSPNAVVRAIIALPLYHSMVKWLFEFKSLDVTDADAIDTFPKLLIDGLRKPPGKHPNPKKSSHKKAE